MNPLYENMATSVFERMSLAAANYGAVNLGQGFPDFGWPDEILDVAARALRDGSNQYAPSRGLPALRNAVAAHYNRHHGTSFGADGICVTSGATEALAAAIFATVNPGDEVIVMTPAYDAYAPLIRRAGGTVREVELRAPDWRIERDTLAAAVGPATRAIILNNPHNPTGRLFDADEIEAVASVARDHDLDRDQRRGVGTSVDGRSVVRHHSFVAGDGGANLQMRIGRENLFADRVENRLDCSRAGDGDTGGARAPVPDLRFGAEFADGLRFRTR